MEAWLVLAGTVFGGAGLKVIEYFLNRRKRTEDLAASIRKELREDVARLRSELRDESKAADEWEAKYWELRAKMLGDSKT